MKSIGPKTTVHDLITAYPFMVNYLTETYPKFAPLKNPAVRSVMARVASLERAAGMAGVPVQELLLGIAAAIKKETGQDVDVVGDETPEQRDRKVEALKGLIGKLHQGASLAEARKEFMAIAGSASPEEIAEMEQALIRDGMPVEEIHRLCDVHVNVFRESLDSQGALRMPAGHPAHTYMAENREIEKAANRWTDHCRRLGTAAAPSAAECAAALNDLAKVEVHYTRKENQLFPCLEKHGFTGPSKVMWSIHDDIRKLIRTLRGAIESGRLSEVATGGLELARQISEMIYKEEKILLPTAVSMIEEDEWARIRAGDDAIGYVFVTPGNEWKPGAQAATAALPKAAGGSVALSTGAMTVEQLDRMLVSLPVEVSFVDDQDVVRFYSDHADRIFPRSPEVIGRTVQNCHPQKSVHIVNAILKAFREGRQNRAAFWINFKGRFVLITYHAVRSKEGTYLGCIEVTQDATDIRSLQGEQKLLDWGPDSPQMLHNL
jgi:uncharacterized protein